jgi:tRNA pseudouridine55 synthase
MDALHGYLLLDKPAGRTSAQVVRSVSHLIHGARCGHLGTLDPAATGLLVACLGDALKLVPYLQKGLKRYIAEVRFGMATDTCDLDGQVVATSEVPAVLQDRISRVLRRFLGTVQQVPPVYSAIKVKGRRLHKSARKGEEVEVPVREVTFQDITIVSRRPDSVVLDVRCSAGTYIRALARDLGSAVNCPAVLASLRRIESTPFHLDDAVQFELLESGRAKVEEHVAPLTRYLPNLPRLVLSSRQAKLARTGTPLAELDAAPAGPILLFDSADRLLGIGEGCEEPRVVRIRRVFSGPASRD